MKRRYLLLLTLAIAALPAVPASAAILWNSVDPHFTINSYTPDGLSTLVTFSVTATSDTSYADVQLLFPWGYRLPAESGATYVWNNTSDRWEGESNYIDIYGVGSNAAVLTLMNTTDVALTDPTPPSPLTAGTVLSSDSVPMIDLGAFTANVPKNFSFKVADGPSTLSGLQVDASFVVPAPEPASLAFLTLGALALLRRRR